MLRASVRIRLGKDAREYAKLVDKNINYKRGGVRFAAGNGTMRIDVEAADAVALLASISGAVKQLRIISEADRLVKAQTAKAAGKAKPVR